MVVFGQQQPGHFLWRRVFRLLCQSTLASTRSARARVLSVASRFDVTMARWRLIAASSGRSPIEALAETAAADRNRRHRGQGHHHYPVDIGRVA
jgi:hypothetical protein